MFTLIVREYVYIYSNFIQDTCTGFLLGGIGELDKNRRANFLVVDSSK